MLNNNIEVLFISKILCYFVESDARCFLVDKVNLRLNIAFDEPDVNALGRVFLLHMTYLAMRNNLR